MDQTKTEWLLRKLADLPPVMRAVLAFICGVIMVPAMPPWCLWPALFLGLSGFYVLLSTTAQKRSAFAFGWLFGFGYFVCGLSWIANALLVEGNEFAWAWPLAVAGLPALLAFFPALACLFIVRFASLKTFGGYLLFTVSIMVFEWLRGHIFTGFPWNLYGYTWTNTLPVAQIASIGGIYFLSLVTCLWATLPGFLWLWPQRRLLKGLLIVFLAVSMGGAYLYGKTRLDQNPVASHTGIAIRLVQPNISQTDKWNPEKTAANLEKLLLLSAPDKLSSFVDTIIVWPETALSDFVLQDSGAAAAIQAVLSGYERPAYLLSGVMRQEIAPVTEQKQYFNSLVAFDFHLNRLVTYNKSHLVPFGEYIPFQNIIPLKPVVQYSGFSSGDGPTVMGIPGLTPRFSPLICYEIIFPGKATPSAETPDFIVNITNDAWYGDSAGPRQHFVMAQFRAIEEGTPVIRVANTGISGTIDPTGRIMVRTKLGKQESLDAQLPQRLAERPLYTTLKDSIFFFFLAFMIGISFSIRLFFQRDKRKSAAPKL